MDLGINNTENQDLKGRVILITGAAGGLGSFAAKTYAYHGATVILLDKIILGLEKTYDDIVANGWPKPAIYPFDLAKANANHYTELAQTIEQTFGVLHGLLHNAAMLEALSPIANVSITNWSETLNVNLNAPFLLTQVLLPMMQKADDASIVFTSDSSARAGRAYWGSFGVAKIAIEGFARILAEELESQGKIRVNILIPGPIDSPMQNQAFPAQNMTQSAKPKVLKDLYVYLLSSRSRGKTGQTFDSTFATGKSK